MRFEGVLKTWNDDRGFGFIEPKLGGQEIFVHIKALPPGTGRPVTDMKVSFELEQSVDGKKKARNVLYSRPARATSRAVGTASSGLGQINLIALFGFAALFLVVTLVWHSTKYFALAYAVMSLVAFLFYWNDKAAAKAGGWRTSEGTLHMLGLLCGWPGAIIAQQVFRHKTAKREFRAVFWTTVIFNVMVFVLLTTPLFAMIS